MNSNSSRRTIVVLSILLLLVLLTVGIVQVFARAQSSQTEQEGPRAVAGPAPNCRYGVAAFGNHQATIDALGAGWYLTFGPTGSVAPNGAEFVHVIRIKQDKDGETYLPTYTFRPALTDAGLGSLVDNNLSELWIIGNEVDRGPNPGGTERIQDDTHPDVYARAYHDAYEFIKGRDPTAQVSPSGLVEVTPNRLYYMDLMWDAYVEEYGKPMPVDVWNMHLYILPEVTADGKPNSNANVAVGTYTEAGDPILVPGKKQSWFPEGEGGPVDDSETCPRDDVYCYAEHDSMEIFEEQVVAMRQWMKEHGQQNKPLLLTEYSILYPYRIDEGGTCYLQDEYSNCFTPERVETFMTNTFNYLGNASDPNLGYPADKGRLVQQWLWYATHVDDTVGSASNLFTDVDTPTFSNLGIRFRDTVQNSNIYVNLVPEKVASPIGFTDPVSGTADVTLTVWVRNNGTSTSGPFTVTFYEDSGLTQPIGSQDVPVQSETFPGMTGCARRAVSVSVPWPDLTPGRHRFWVKVDSANVIAEGPPGQSEEADNVLSGVAIIDPLQNYLPAVPRP